MEVNVPRENPLYHSKHGYTDVMREKFNDKKSFYNISGTQKNLRKC